MRCLTQPEWEGGAVFSLIESVDLTDIVGKIEAVWLWEPLCQGIIERLGCRLLTNCLANICSYLSHKEKEEFLFLLAYWGVEKESSGECKEVGKILLLADQCVWTEISSCQTWCSFDSVQLEGVGSGRSWLWMDFSCKWIEWKVKLWGTLVKKSEMDRTQ